MAEPTTASASSPEDEAFMRRALELAAHARDADGEVPVGAVLVLDDAVVGEGWNRNITLNDPSAHAKIGVLRDAGKRLGNHRFPDSILYVTLEPCAMCAMALVHARVARGVLGSWVLGSGLVSQHSAPRDPTDGGVVQTEMVADGFQGYVPLAGMLRWQMWRNKT